MKSHSLGSLVILPIDIDFPNLPNCMPKHTGIRVFLHCFHKQGKDRRPHIHYFFEILVLHPAARRGLHSDL